MENLNVGEEKVSNSLINFDLAKSNKIDLSLANKTWENIVRFNRGSLTVSMCLLVVDTAILFSEPSLFPFYVEMLLAFGILVACHFWDNYLAKIYNSTDSKLDKWIYALVILRDIVVISNLIPFIQIAGAYFAIVGVVPFVIIHLILLYFRNKVV